MEMIIGKIVLITLVINKHFGDGDLLLTGHARGESTRPAVLRSTTTSKWLLGGPCLTPRVRGVVLNIRQELQFWVRNIYNDIFGTRAQI